MSDRAVVDASVVLAWLQDEPGADAAEAMLMEGVIGAANWSEVLQKTRQAGAQPEQVARLLNSFGLEVSDVTQPDAERAASLWRRGSGLSLADRLCLALAVRLGLAAATTDAAWLAEPTGATITLIRSGTHRIAEARLPLFESGQPDLAERADELLTGFGDR